MLATTVVASTVDLAALAPGAEVTLAEPVPFGSCVDEDIRQLVFLREATSRSVRLTWRMTGVPLLDWRSLAHLLPPDAGETGASAAFARAWRERYRYGLYYYRCGPGFIHVKDIRPGGPAARMTIEDNGLFDELISASSLDQLSSQAAEALGPAIEADLAVAGETRFAILPYRMRHWPVSCVAV